jgi:hypothetical protein
MEIDSRAITFIQSLQGSQALVVLAYFIARRGLTIEEIERVIGRDNDTVRKAVKKLSDKGLLHMQRGEHGRQTWIPAGGTFFGLVLGQNPRTSDSGSSSSIVISNSLPIEEEQEESPESENFGLCLAACDEVGIRKPKREKIARLEHVTPEFIRGHVKMAKAQGFPIGTAIFRIENNWELEEPKEVSRESFEWFSHPEETGPLRYELSTLEDLWSQGHHKRVGTCSVCGAEGWIVGTRDNDYCIDHYNEWRRAALGFDENGLRK